MTKTSNNQRHAIAREIMAEFAPARRRGFWATVRYARSLGKPVTIVWPDGRTKNEPIKQRQGEPT